jgi:ribulose-phosphate 3-epimerase
MRNYKIAASILSADFACLGKEVKDVINAGAHMIHFDVMDNHYVPNLTVGPLVCNALREFGITAPIDVHLMTNPVDNLIIDFAKAGATYITFHPEASQHVDRSLQLIHDCGCKGGLAFNPATPLEYLQYVWEKLDIILLMSVNPGFAAQKFIASALPKISAVRSLINTYAKKNPPLLEVDGGIKLENLADVANAGADTFVIGSGLFCVDAPYAATLKKIGALLQHI